MGRMKEIYKGREMERERKNTKDGLMSMVSVKE